MESVGVKSTTQRNLKHKGPSIMALLTSTKPRFNMLVGSEGRSHKAKLGKVEIFQQILIRLDQNNFLVPVTRQTLAQNVLNRRLNTFLRAPANCEFIKWNQTKLVAIFSKWRWCRLGVHGFYLGYWELITRICLKTWNVPFHS